MLRASEWILGLALATSLSGASQWKGVLVDTSQVTTANLRKWKHRGASAVTLQLTEKSGTTAAKRIRDAHFQLYYWIEIGRSPALADAHPEWMASIQGHPEWRRLFPELRKPGEGEVVKNYPWVPVLYKESFDAHLSRVAVLLKNNAPADGIFLNDLQGAPSACGCGNNLCRWTTDYGPIQTATRLANDAAANFVAGVAKLGRQAKVIPVWATECEEHDKAERCAGVGCFAGTCWREYTAQLMPLAKQSDKIAVLAPYRAFDREAEWVKRALASFQEMPPKRNGQAVAATRLIAVVQGWDVSPAEVKAQVRMIEAAGAAGQLVSLVQIEQGWKPRIIRISGHE